MAETWPFPPQSKVAEVLQWKTDVIRCKAAEQRICLRNIPRTVFEYDYHFSMAEVEAATYLARTFMLEDFMLPIWSDGDYVGALSASASSIVVDTTKSRYLAGAHVFIVDDDNRYEIVEIATVLAGQLDLVTPFVTLGYANAFIAPCFPGKLQGALDIRKTTAAFTTIQAAFIYTQNFGDVPANPYPVFKASYVMADRPIISGSLAENQRRELIAFPNLAGPLFHTPSYEYAIGKSTVSWSFDTRAQLQAFRAWLFTVKGKQGSFYLPRWSYDFLLTVDIAAIDTTMTVSANIAATNGYTGPICVIMADGTQYYNEILSWAPQGGGNHVATLSASFGSEILVADIELITRMPKMRFNADSISFNHIIGQSSSVRIAVMEAPE